MSPELETKMITRWPNWFRVGGDIRHTLMPLGFQHGDGWIGLLWQLCVDLEPLVTSWELKSGDCFEVLEVKQKLGGLRFYTNADDDKVRQRIEAAVLDSFQTCEICGRPGKLNEAGHISTLCDSCVQKGWQAIS